MAASISPSGGWVDDHTLILSQLYTLYDTAIKWNYQLCDEGYSGFPDPIYYDDNEKYTPDLLAYGEMGDAQHFGVCGVNEQSVVEELEEIQPYHNIDEDSISEFLELYDRDFTPNIQETVAIIPKTKFIANEEDLLRIANEREIIIWSINFDSSKEISKECGTHSNATLEGIISDGLRPYPDGRDTLRYTRDTNPSILKFEFIDRLVRSCSREKIHEFSFNDVDGFMIDIDPPLLAHLPRKEREGEHWEEYLHTMIFRFDLIEPIGDDEYRWEEKRFVDESRYRSRILERIKDELGLGD
ncbi:hypothetical protein GJ631_15035 [Natronomonas sp. CBA1123]|uniref:hypothetical protein n=1 Tax=Natronomonas sp. CBA1123 TaxID=2668070 RepID=UPI0012EABD8A|nr:hypothetical protein [Natronomonas sp. CBA1123]MUV87830.1 hypothetical protein [Natronomonas sp. CBA1123]